jgi:hypothetical protein
MLLEQWALTMSGLLQSTRLPSWALSACLTLSAALWCCPTQGAVEISGEVQYTVFPKSPDASSMALNFRVCLSSNAWEVETTDPRHLRPTFKYACSEGKMLYERDFSKLAKLSSREPSTNTLIRRIYEIYPGEAIPGLSSDLVFPVWLTFVSPRFMTNEQPSIPDFTAGLRALSNNVTALRVSIHGSSGEGAFPEELNFENPGVLQSVGPHGEAVSHALSPPYDKGYRCATYRVKVWTNVLGAQYPMNSSLDTLLPAYGNSASQGQASFASHSEVIVHSIHLAPSDTVPRPNTFVHGGHSDPVLVDDYTLKTRYNLPLNYVSEDPQALVTNGSPRYQPILAQNEAFQKIQLERDAHVNLLSKYRPLVWFLFGVLFVPPVMLIIIKKKGNK